MLQQSIRFADPSNCWELTSIENAEQEADGDELVPVLDESGGQGKTSPKENTSRDKGTGAGLASVDGSRELKQGSRNKEDEGGDGVAVPNTETQSLIHTSNPNKTKIRAICGLGLGSR